MNKPSVWFSTHQALTPELSVQFNVLRAIAALLVCMGHGYLIFYYPIYKSPTLPLYLFGHAAVMVLFINSGFLIAKSVSANAQRNAQFKLMEYVGARVNRILPPFYCSLLLMLFLYLIAPYCFATGTREFEVISPVMSRAKVQLDGLSLIGCIGFVNEFITRTPVMNFAYWTLPMEIWCYALFGLVVSARGRWGMGLSFALLLLLGYLNFAFVCYILVWLLGVGIALLHSHQKPFSKRIAMGFLGASLVVAAGCYLFYRYALPVGADTEKAMLAMYGMLSGLWVACFIYLVVYGKIRLPSFAQSLSNSSYTLYLIHFPIVLFVYGIIQPYVYQNLLTLSIAYALCVVFCVLASALLAKKVEHIRWMRVKN